MLCNLFMICGTLASIVSPRYFGFGHSAGGGSTTAGEYGTPCPAASTVTKLTVNASVAPGVGNTIVVTVYESTDAGVTWGATPISVTITNSSPAGVEEWTGSVAFAEGNIYALRVERGTGTATTGDLRCTLTCEPDDKISQLQPGGYNTTAFSTASNEYGLPCSHRSPASAETAFGIPYPTAGSITKIAAYGNNLVGAGNTLDVTVRVGGVSSDVSCQLTNSSRYASDSGNAAIVAGDIVTVLTVPTSSPTVGKLGWCCVWTPTTVGECVYGSHSTATTATTYFALLGQPANSSGTTVARCRLAQGATVTKLYTIAWTGPSPGNWTGAALIDTTAQTNTTSMSGAASPTTAQDTTNSDTATAGERWQLRLTAASSPASSALAISVVFSVASTSAGTANPWYYYASQAAALG